jgi:hypothetical protein
LRAQVLMHDHLHVHVNEQNLTWRKSSASNPTGNCVELAELSSGDVAVRNSRFPGGAVIVCTRAEVAAFLDGARAGEFDDLAG